MKRTSTTVNCAAAKIEPASRRSVLLFAVLPFSPLLIGTGLAPALMHRAQASATAAAYTVTDSEVPGIESSEVQLEKIQRRVALHTVDRLEKEIQQNGGKVRVSALDLRRLRSALSKPE